MGGGEYSLFYLRELLWLCLEDRMESVIYTTHADSHRMYSLIVSITSFFGWPSSEWHIAPVTKREPGK